MLFWIMFIIAFIPLVIIFPAKVFKRKNLKQVKGGAVLVCNHYSNLDCIELFIHLRKHIRFLAKTELFNTKFKRHFFKTVGCIEIKRGEADINAIKNSLAVLKKNKILGVFPEGTRNLEEKEGLGEVHSGAIVIAARAGVPIIPTLIYRKPKAFRKNYIIIGEPFFVESQIPKKPTPEEIEAARQKLINVSNDLRKQIDEKLTKKKKG